MRAFAVSSDAAPMDVFPLGFSIPQPVAIALPGSFILPAGACVWLLRRVGDIVEVAALEVTHRRLDACAKVFKPASGRLLWLEAQLSIVAPPVSVFSAAIHTWLMSSYA